MELLLIRHGRPGLPAAGETASGGDPALSEEGRRQAGLLGDWLSTGPGPRPDVVYCSPMIRAQETAAEIVRRTGRLAHTDDRLREFDWGSTLYQAPGLNLASDEHAERWRALETGRWGPHRFDPDVFEKTVCAAFNDIIAAHPSAVVAVVCHAGVINSFLGTVLRRPRGMFFQPDYTSVSRLRASRRGHRQVIALNDVGHLTLAHVRVTGDAPS